MVSLMVTLFSTKCFLFVYMYIDLFKLKAYKLFENSDADLSCHNQLVTENTIQSGAKGLASCVGREVTHTEFEFH